MEFRELAGPCARVTFLALIVVTSGQLFAAPGRTNWGAVPEAERGAAYAPRNARSTVSVVRQALSTADPSGGRGFEFDADTEALRGTFRIDIPLLELRGRTAPTRLSLHYQARVWFGSNEADMSILDGDVTNAPGWSLGIPKILGGILVESDGSRRPARRTTVVGNALEDVDVSYVTTDGSNITYRVRLRPALNGTDPTSAIGEIHYPNGSVTFLRGQAGNNPAGRTSVLYSRLYASAVIDPSGNATSYEYSHWGSETLAARPTRMIDPLGREVRFHYNQAWQLTAITATGEGNQDRTLARLTYRVVPAYTYVHPTDPAGDRSWATFAVEGIYFPATGTGYWFGDADSYTQYAMLRKVLEQSQMSHASPSLTEQGTLGQGNAFRTRVYDLPLVAPATGDRTAFPRYTRLTETIAGVATPLVTQYWVYEQPGGAIVDVRLPDGTRRITIQDARGLPLSREVNAADGSLVSYDQYAWSQAAAVPRLDQLTETDPLGRKRRTEYVFNAIGQLQDVKVRDWVEPAQLSNAPLLRWTRYSYLTDAAYASRGIANLVRRVETYDGSSLLPEERTEFEYDGAALVAAPNIDRNIFFTPGFLPEVAQLLGPGASARSGHVTKINRWVEPSVQGYTSVISTQSRYTQAGALSDVSVDGRRLFSLKYSAVTKFAFPDEITLGEFVSKRVVTYSRAALEWNVPIGELAVVRQPSRGTIQFSYDAGQRLWKTEDTRGETRIRTYHPDAHSFTDAYSKNGTPLRAVKTEFDGRGLPIRITTTVVGSLAVEALFDYDLRGRVERMARGLVGSPANWSRLAYDSAGRIRSSAMPDGSADVTDYGRAGSPPELISTGTVRRQTDALQRSRYIVTDGLGRVVQVLEPPSAGTNWISTVFKYDARSNLISVSSDANRSGNAVATRRFQYDGLSRLTRRYLIERSPTLNAAGKLSSQGIWSDVYWYDGQSKLIRHADPRGVVVDYDYGVDPLRRLKAIRVVAPAPSAIAPPVLPTAETRFYYMRSGDPLRLERLEVDGLLTERYRYDALSRLDEIITTFSARSSAPLRQSATWNRFGQVERYSVGVVGQPEVSVQYGYDTAGRRVKVSNSDPGIGFSVTAQIDGVGSLDGLTFESGTWRAEEKFTIDALKNRFSRQTLAVQNQTAADYSFFYDQASLSSVLGTHLSNDPAGTGQLKGIRDNRTGVVSELGYDALGRTNRVVSGPTGPSRFRSSTGLEYAYDLAGNRVSSVALQYLPTALPTGGTLFPRPLARGGRDLGDGAADGMRAIVVDRLSNRITSPGFSYDAAGNVVRLPRKDGSALGLQYDGLGRLRKVERLGTGVSEEYDYSAGNQRVLTRTASGPLTFTVWSGPTATASFAAPSPTAPMVFATTSLSLVGRQVARITGPATNRKVDFIHTTPSALITTTAAQSGSVSAGTAPFGTGPLSSSSVNQFHTYERSPFGLDYAINRYYDPETGRFVQPDPLAETGYRLSDPQTLNLYAFLRNDPLNGRDPLGLDGCDAGGVATSTPDGGLECSYFYPKTVYETVVHANSGDTQGIVSQWGPNNAWFSGWAPWQAASAKESDQDVQDAIDNALLKKLREMREKREKHERCAAANATFAAAANAYARVAANVAMHNLTVEALQYSSVEVGADFVENYFEQREDFSAPQAGAGVVGRGAAAMSIRKQYQAAKINQALMQADQKAAVESMKTAAAARDNACR